MNPEQLNIFFEVLGYVGMGLVLLAFLMKNMIWLRIINLTGSILCGIYGLWTKTYPTLILNAGLAAINVVMLTRSLIVWRMAQVAKKHDPSEPFEPVELPKEEDSNE